MNRSFLYCLATTAVLLAQSTTSRLQAQSADALIDKLVEKGILSVKEANELREEADRNFSQAYSVKSGLPDFVQALRISGDLRARYEGFYSDARYAESEGGGEFVNRSRYRFRVRVGIVASLFENLEVGLRLGSAEPLRGGGGDPISGNTTFQDNASRKAVFIDQAYGRWYFQTGPSISGNITV